MPSLKILETIKSYRNPLNFDFKGRVPSLKILETIKSCRNPLNFDFKGRVPSLEILETTLEKIFLSKFSSSRVNSETEVLVDVVLGMHSKSCISELRRSVLLLTTDEHVDLIILKSIGLLDDRGRFVGQVMEKRGLALMNWKTGIVSKIHVAETEWRLNKHAAHSLFTELHLALLVEDGKVWSKWVVDELLFLNWLIKVHLRTTNFRFLLILRTGICDFLGVERGLVDVLSVLNWLLRYLSLHLGDGFW